MSTRKTIRERLAERKSNAKKKQQVTFSDMRQDMARSPMIAFGLGVSAFLTALSGLFIGLAPKLDEFGNLILFGGRTGWGAIIMGVTFGILYMTVFPVIGEAATYYWYRRAALRDENNLTQTWVSYTMLTVTFAFMIVTAVAASFILASLLHTFEAFNAIPLWTQKWTVLIIPFAAAAHAGANMLYDHVSAYAEERRLMERDLQSAQNEAENRIRQAQLDAKERAAIAMADRYEALAREGAVKVGQDLADVTWRNDRAQMSGDADNDGIVDLIDDDVNIPDDHFDFNDDELIPEPIKRGNGSHP